MAPVNPVRFSTKYQDDESELLYYGYRYYNPVTGRWMSRDSINEAGFRALTAGRYGLDRMSDQNPFGFVHQDAVNFHDYLGLKFEDPSFWCKDPCKWATKHRDSATESGVTLCCNGKKYGCVTQRGGSNGATHPIAIRIIDSCAQQHEDYHVSDPLVICEKKCGLAFATYRYAAEARHTECEAWSRTMLCLAGLYYQCNGDKTCEAQLDIEIKEAKATAEDNRSSLPRR